MLEFLVFFILKYFTVNIGRKTQLLFFTFICLCCRLQYCQGFFFPKTHYICSFSSNPNCDSDMNSKASHFSFKKKSGFRSPSTIKEYLKVSTVYLEVRVKKMDKQGF